jgi:hypothetical protein
MIGLIRRFVALDGARRGLLCEAAILIVAARVGLKCFGFLTVRRLLDRYVARFPCAAVDGDIVAAGRWAVTAAAARVHATCLVQALAGDVLLRRRGVAATLRIGVRPGGPVVPIEAHAWVECEGEVAIGFVEFLPELSVLSATHR